MAEGKPVSSKYKIKVTRNGPYLVSGGAPLSEQAICKNPGGECHGWRELKTYPRQATYALCRCGQSRNKPFCDGSHAGVGFDGAETAPHEPYLAKAREIPGPGIKLTDNEDLCAGAGFCQRGEGTWKLTRQSGDSECRKTALEEVWDCPSGRLVAWGTDDRAIEPRLDPSIALIQGPAEGQLGPIWVRGGIPIESADGKPYEVRNRVTLCRCGKSKNKPFCDGSHEEG